MTTPITALVRVCWGDCDPAGIVFYPRFFEWMDACSEQLHKLLGIKRTGGANLRGLPLVEVKAEFLAPAVFDDEVELRASVVSIGRTSFDLRYDFVRTSDHVMLARTHERRVYVTRGSVGSMEPVPLSDEMRAALSAHVDAGTTATT
jgi:4-hydroxybenzoyl-CoA thioesterase